jgi:hypothetical protein
MVLCVVRTSLVASLSALGRPQLVHLLHALLELLVLAFLVRVSLVLCIMLASSKLLPSIVGHVAPRTSMVGRTPRTDTGSRGSEDVRTSLGMAGAVWRRSSPHGWPLCGAVSTL